MTVLLALALVACGDDDGSSGVGDAGGNADAGGPGADGGTPGTDAGPSDPCELSGDVDAIEGVGCNGFMSTAAPDGADFGNCTLSDDPDDFQGTCTSEDALCYSDDDVSGVCVPFCEPGPTGLSTSTCPTGSRCFAVEEDIGFCFRDCDSAHPCPDGQECDEDGSCIGPAPTTGG